MHLGPFSCLTKLGAKRAELVQKFVPRSRLEFFAMKAPDPPHWTLSSCFGAFCTIWVHLGPFGCLTKLGAKRAELVQKFVPQSQIGIFLENAPDPPHMTLNSCFGAFRIIWVHKGIVMLPYETRGNTGRTCKSSCHEVASKFFATNVPGPSH